MISRDHSANSHNLRKVSEPTVTLFHHTQQTQCKKSKGKRLILDDLNQSF